MADGDPFQDSPQWHTNPLHKPSTSFHMNPMYHPVPDAPLRTPPPAKDDIFRFAPPEMRLRSGSYNDVLQAAERPGPPLKRRSRSLTDITSVLPITPGSSSWGSSPVCDLPMPSHPPPTGKVAIRRAPEEILGRPVHIVTKQEKKAAHSAMERRYRKELNVQINLLRQLVMPGDDDGSVNKVTVLKNTTDRVRALRQQQQALLRPVMQLPPEHRELYTRWITAEEAVADLEDRLGRQARMIESLEGLAMGAAAAAAAATAEMSPAHYPLAAVPLTVPTPTPPPQQQHRLVAFSMGSPATSPQPSPQRRSVAPPPPPPSRVVPPSRPSASSAVGGLLAPSHLPPLPTVQPPRPLVPIAPPVMLPEPPPPLIKTDAARPRAPSSSSLSSSSLFHRAHPSAPGHQQAVHPPLHGLHEPHQLPSQPHDEHADVFNAVNFDAYEDQSAGALFDTTGASGF